MLGDNIVCRELNFLKDSDRNVRKRALSNLKKEVQAKQLELSKDDYQTFATQTYKPILKCFHDSSERCRELASEILREFVQLSASPEEFLSYTIAVFVQRLGAFETVESSEEVRLLQVQILREILKRCGDRMAPYLDDLICILRRTIVDPYHEVKKEACLCAMDLAAAIPSKFHMQSEQLVKPIVQTLAHQHARVRSIAIKAIGAVIQYGNNKSIEDVTSPLAQLLFDQSSAVRLAVTTVVGKWLYELPDRYSYFNKLVPILLTSLTDEVEEIRKEAQMHWETAGKQYETENEEKYKDHLDFQKPPPLHYPEGIKRPSIGCRMLVQHNFYHIIPALINDMANWVGNVRIKAASLLRTLLLHQEENATMYLEKLLPTMQIAASDEEKEVIFLIEKSAEVLGYFVKPDVWLKWILPAISDSSTAGKLCILAALIKRSKAELLAPDLEILCNTLAQPSVCRTFQSEEQNQLVSCVGSVLYVCGDKAKDVALSLFVVLMTVNSLTTNQDKKERIDQMMTALAAASTLSGREELYNLYSENILDQLQQNHQLWEIHSPELLIFCSLLTESGPFLGHTLQKTIPLIQTNLNEKKDPEVRLKLLTLLSSLMMQPQATFDSSGLLHTVVPTLIKDIILPNLVWHAGRTAEALRAACVTFFWALVKTKHLNKTVIEPHGEEILSRLISLMEDELATTRHMTCSIFLEIMPVLLPIINPNKLYNLYPEFLKRMDDVNDDIRIAVTDTFASYFKNFPEEYDARHYCKHLEAIYSGLLLHMDDANRNVQQAVLDLLIYIAPLDPKTLLEETNKVKSKHRSQEFCDALVDHIQNLQLN